MILFDDQNQLLYARTLLSRLLERSKQTTIPVTADDIFRMRVNGIALFSSFDEVHFLEKAGLVHFDARKLPGQTVVSLTARGEAWLEIDRRGDYSEELIESNILKVLKARTEDESGPEIELGELTKRLQRTHPSLGIVDEKAVLTRTRYLVGKGFVEWLGLQGFSCQITSHGEDELRRSAQQARLPTQYRLHLEDIDSFAKVRGVPPGQIIDKLKSHGYLDLSEEEIQVAIEKILSETLHKKDWGGEINDLYTSNVTLSGTRIAAAFLLKGHGLKSKLMQISDCGKNGDQLLRLLQSPADLFVVQFVGDVSEAVISDMEGKIKQRRAEGRNAWYCIINGIDTARLLAAYGEVPL